MQEQEVVVSNSVLNELNDAMDGNVLSQGFVEMLMRERPDYIMCWMTNWNNYVVLKEGQCS